MSQGGDYGGAGPLARFLQKLRDEQQIVDAQARFRQLVEADEELSAQQKELLLRGDPHEIRHALADEYGDVHSLILFFIAGDS